MTWLVTVLGAVLVALVLRDIFATLWQPTGQGRLTSAVMVGVWRLARGGSRRGPQAAGPLAMVLVVVVWTALVVLGWALVYLPHVPDGFSYSGSLRPGERGPALDAAYLSLVTIGTLGYGDVVPVDTWLRLVVPLQGLMGFVLLTAAVSWVLQVYPALARRRVLALRLSTLRRAQQGRPATGLGSSTGAQLLVELAAAVAVVRVDLSQHPESYYHREADEEAALARMLGYAVDLADEGERSDREDVRLGGAALRESITDLCTVLGREFGHDGGEREVLEQFARAHGHRLAT